MEQPDEEAARLIDSIKGQLLIVLLRRLGGKVVLPVEEVDGTGDVNLAISVDVVRKEFKMELVKKTKEAQA